MKCIIVLLLDGKDFHKPILNNYTFLQSPLSTAAIAIESRHGKDGSKHLTMAWERTEMTFYHNRYCGPLPDQKPLKSSNLQAPD